VARLLPRTLERHRWQAGAILAVVAEGAELATR